MLTEKDIATRGKDRGRWAGLEKGGRGGEEGREEGGHTVKMFGLVHTLRKVFHE